MLDQIPQVIQNSFKQAGDVNTLNDQNRQKFGSVLEISGLQIYSFMQSLNGKSSKVFHVIFAEAVC